MHLSYVRNCSFVNPEALSVISFMQHSLVEIFLLNEELAYQHVFVYIRQMAIHLRNAIKDKTEVGYSALLFHSL
jgi:nucleolar complex protein 2